MSYLNPEQQRFTNFTPDHAFESSVPTPDSASNGQISRSYNATNSSGSRSGFYPLNPNNTGSTDFVNSNKFGSPNNGPSVFMETSFRVMSPESEITAASLRTLQGIRVPNEHGSGGNPENHNPMYPQSKLSNNSVCNVHVVSDKVSTTGMTYNTQQHERTFKPVEQIVAGRSAQISPTCCSVNAAPPHPNRITPGNQHQVGSDIAQQHQQQQQIHHPVCHRVFSPSSGGPGGVGGVSGGMQHQQPMGGQGTVSMGGYNQQQDYTTPPFPHTTHFTGAGGMRSVSPCSPEQTFSNKKKNLSQSSISLPAMKPVDPSLPSQVVTEQPQVDAISLGRESLRRSRAETEPGIVEPEHMQHHLNPNSAGANFHSAGSVGDETRFKSANGSFVEPQPIYTWGFQLWECFSDTKWCLITGLCPCVTEFVLSQTFGLQRLAFSFVVSSLSIIALLTAQFFLVQPGKDSLGAGLSDGFMCNVMLYFLLMLRLFLAFKLRHKIRNEYQISGSALSDCCVICVCPYCALCQMKQHYDYYDGSDSEDEGDDADSNPTGGGIGGLNLTLSPFNIASNHPNKQSPRAMTHHHHHNSSSGFGHNHHECPNHPPYKSRFASEVRGFKQSPISQIGKFLDYSSHFVKDNTNNNHNNNICNGTRCHANTCNNRMQSLPPQPAPCCLGNDVVAMTHHCNYNPANQNHAHGPSCGNSGQSYRGNVWLVNPDSQSQPTVLHDGTRVNMSLHRY